MTLQISSAMGSSDSRIPKMQVWLGRILSTLAALFLVFDGTLKLVKPPLVVRATVQLGYAESAILGIGATLLACTLFYALPRTSGLGAVLLTGYLGGAVASNVRAAMPTFNIVFPLIVAVFLWSGLWLRDLRVRNLLRP